MRDRTKMRIESFASIAPPEEFSLAPDGRACAFTQAVGAYRQIFTLALDRPAWPRRVTATLDDCGEPHWSPDSRSLVFVREQALWVANGDGTHARELTDHPAGNSSPSWSPDGTRIAFLSRRRGWTHIWTIAPDGQALTQVTRGAFDVCDLAWSPDGKWLAYSSWRAQDLRMRGIYLVPVGGGDERLISPPGCWSGAPSFSPDGRTLGYLCDQDGWFHVYLYDLSSNTVRQLTHGQGEDGGPHFYNVESTGGPQFAPDGKQIAFIRHREGKWDVWVADVATGDARRVSRGEGHYRIVGWRPDSKCIAVTFDNPTTPADLWLIALEGEPAQVTHSAVEELQAQLCAPQWITYASHDGLQIPAALFRPADDPEEKVFSNPEEKAFSNAVNHRGTARAPAVVFIHGGPNIAFGEVYYPLPQILAHAGYVVLAPNYRGSTGYGNAFREANFRAWGQADALDVVEGARWLQMQDFVDADHIAVLGPSYGGYLTLCALTLAPDLFCAGVDLYGDSEITEAYRHEDREARLDLIRHMGTPEENPEGYRRGSPLHLAERIQSPLLILHGRDDMLVVPLMSDKLIEALKIENKYFESHFYEGEEHGFDRPENKKDAWERVVKFLDRFCGRMRP
ncbi:MAG: S9 family peptidase [Chloroflexi bacterium]|nr:S9 family peptidase [Chloroflexota bacterium]